MATTPIEPEKKSESYFDFKPVQEVYPFYFKIYDFKKIGWVFLLTMTIIPFVALLFMRIFLPGKDNLNTIGLVMEVLNFVCLVATFITFVVYDWKLLKISGLIWFFIPLLSFKLFVLFLSLLAIPISNQGNGRAILFLAGQMLFELLFIILFLIYNPTTRKRIALTFKLNWPALILIALATASLLWVTSSIIWPLIVQHIPALQGQSENQKGLDSDANFLVIKILNFLFVVLIAPFYEEMVYRNFFFKGFGNKIVAFFASAITFALIHVSAGDMEHIVPYLIGGFFLSGIFTLMKGNVTYSWLTHLIYNLIGAILALAL